MRATPHQQAAAAADKADTAASPLSLRGLQAAPGHMIRRAQQIAVAIFMEETAPFDVTPVQFAALVAVAEYPDIDATRLSSLIALDRATLGHVVTRLQAKGWVERAQGVRDRRTKRVRITPAGTRLLREAAPAMLRAQERILAPATREQRALFMNVLGRLVDANNLHSRAPLRTAVAPDGRSGHS